MLWYDIPAIKKKGVKLMDQKIIEMVERLDEERLNLFLNYLQGILDSQEPIQADDQKDSE